ncbi:hypothetical protein [Rhizobium leguminosarum]|uniref:hypothetical protein n=1 Tax=Rhizobium leguminosarum TaxID=384 RepID=UPI002E0DF441|nr:hypothetical protein U8Q02_36455 [Rhizobium leguminosarum]
MMTEADQATATREDVAAIVQEVRDAWISATGPANVTSVYDINSGPCYDFACEVVDLVLERFPGTEIDVEDYEERLYEDGLTAQGIHYYVILDGWYFDASRPKGEASPDYLPTCQSIRICATSLEGGEDNCEQGNDDYVGADGDETASLAV